MRARLSRKTLFFYNGVKWLVAGKESWAMMSSLTDFTLRLCDVIISSVFPHITFILTILTKCDKRPSTKSLSLAKIGGSIRVATPTSTRFPAGPDLAHPLDVVSRRCLSRASDYPTSAAAAALFHQGKEKKSPTSPFSKPSVSLLYCQPIYSVPLKWAHRKVHYVVSTHTHKASRASLTHWFPHPPGVPVWVRLPNK